MWASALICAARRMVAHGRGGCIVNVASILGERVAGGVAPYAVSKAGVIQVTQTLAAEWGGAGVRVEVDDRLVRRVVVDHGPDRDLDQHVLPGGAVLILVATVLAAVGLGGKGPQARFDRLEGLYAEWNARINVISRQDIENLATIGRTITDTRNGVVSTPTPIPSTCWATNCPALGTASGFAICAKPPVSAMAKMMNGRASGSFSTVLSLGTSSCSAT